MMHHIEFENFIKLAQKEKTKRRLHALAQKKLASYLSLLYPYDYAVSEVSAVLGGRNDLIMFAYDGSRVAFEFFFSPNQVPQDLRLLELVEANAKIAILLDREVNPKLAGEYFHKKPDHFPFLWLSDLLISSQQEACLTRLDEILSKNGIQQEVLSCAKENSVENLGATSPNPKTFHILKKVLVNQYQHLYLAKLEVQSESSSVAPYQLFTINDEWHALIHNGHTHETRVLALQHLLQERRYHFLNTLHPKLQSYVIEVLKISDKVLSQVQTKGDTPDLIGPPALVPFLITLHIRPDINPLHASSAAIAIELLICSFTLLADNYKSIAQETIEQQHISDQVLNDSQVLKDLAYQIILSLLEENSTAEEHVQYILETLNDSCLKIADAYYKENIIFAQKAVYNIAVEECIEVASSKTGLLMRLACLVGVLIADANHKQRELFSELGTLLGTAYQLDDDGRVLSSTLSKGSTTILMEDKLANPFYEASLLNKKRTLPIVLAGQLAAKAEGIHQETTKFSDNKKTIIEGTVITWGISLLYLERARSCLQKIEVNRPFDPIMRKFLGLK